MTDAIEYRKAVMSVNGSCSQEWFGLESFRAVGISNGRLEVGNVVERAEGSLLPRGFRSRPPQVSEAGAGSFRFRNE